MSWIAQSPADAGEWVNVRFSIQGEPVVFDVEGQPFLDTVNGRQVVFTNPDDASGIIGTVSDDMNGRQVVFSTDLAGAPSPSTLDGRQVVYSARTDELGILGTVSSTGSWLDATFDNRHDQLNGRYAAERSRVQRSREQAIKRARRLLFEHLSKEQRADYEKHAYFDVPSSSSPGEIFFRLIHQNVSNIHVHTRRREDAFPERGRSLPPQPAFGMSLSEGLDRASFWMSLISGQSRSTNPPDVGVMRHHRTLCLVPRNYGAPIEDQLLAQKLLIETDEPAMWRTAR